MTCHYQGSACLTTARPNAFPGPAVNHWGYFIYLNWMPTYFYKVLGEPCINEC